MNDESTTYNWIAKYLWIFGWLSALVLLILSAAWFLRDKDYESGIAFTGFLSGLIAILFKKGLKGLLFGLGIIFGAILAGALLFFIPQFGSEAIKEEIKQAKAEKGRLEAENVALKKRVSDLEAIAAIIPGQHQPLPEAAKQDEPLQQAPQANESPQPTATSTVDKPSITNISSSWFRLDYDIQWRVRAIQPQTTFTRLFVEVRNTDEKSEHLFRSFGKVPLVMIDSTGRLFKMINSSDAPEKIREDDRHWYLQAGRTITVAVDFEPLARGSNSGHIAYQDKNKAEPAKFSFAR